MATRGAGPYVSMAAWEMRELQDRLRRLAATSTNRNRHRVSDKTVEIRRIASEYGVDPRTVYRWMRRDYHEVVVGRYRALFAVGRGSEPMRITPWEEAA